MDSNKSRRKKKIRKRRNKLFLITDSILKGEKRREEIEDESKN